MCFTCKGGEIEMKKFIVLTAVTSLLTGCMVGPDYVAPDSEIANLDITKEKFSRDAGLWKTSTPLDAMPKGDWWKIFNDPVLEGLMFEAKRNNPDLAAAFYSVERARQAARMTESELYPWASGNASYSRTGSSKNVRPNSSETIDKWSIGLGLTWDLDLFGRVRSLLEAEIANAQAQLDAYQNMMLLLQASVADTYFTLCQHSSEIELLERTLAVRKEQTLFVERRVKFDFSSELDLQRALQEEYEAAAQLAAVKRNQAIAENQLAALLGKTPAQLNLKVKPLGDNLPKIPRAVPSELLERRPDIAAAERAVYAANAQIGAAQAAFYPTVSLSANTSLSANKFENLLEASSFAWGVSPEIYIPIFQAGRIYAQKQVALAAHKQTLEKYRATVLAAIVEVENAMSNINLLEAEYKRRSEVTAASIKVQDLTKKQYDLGYVDYFSVSDAQRNALLNERTQLTLKSQRFKACVSFIAALGGGWHLDDNKSFKPESDWYEKSKDKAQASEMFNQIEEEPKAESK